jgi:flagellar hook assembly protein FlgD
MRFRVYALSILIPLGITSTLAATDNGRLIRTKVDAKRDAGLHKVIWDGTNESGRTVFSGIYWVRMRTGAYVSNSKMVKLR